MYICTDLLLPGIYVDEDRDENGDTRYRFRYRYGSGHRYTDIPEEMDYTKYRYWHICVEIHTLT